MALLFSVRQITYEYRNGYLGPELVAETISCILRILSKDLPSTSLTEPNVERPPGA